MSPLKKEKIYTIDDIYSLPDGERAELIDRHLYSMAPPSTGHQRLVKEFVFQIEAYIREHEGFCEVFPSPFAVFLLDDQTTYVEPDISVICDRSKLTEDGCHGAPDWIIEIVSPSSRSMDCHRKLFLYRTAGVREYWIVDAAKCRITVYNFEQETTEDYPLTGTIPAGIYEDFSIKLQA